MARGLTEWRAVGSELGTTYFFALLADAQRTAGRLDEAWRSLDAADEISQRTGEGWWQPEVLRLRAGLLSRRGAPVAEVEAILSSALALARSRSASALSLRSAVSLAELHVQQGRGDEARVLLRSGLAPFDQVELDGNPDIPQARALERSLS
jgi:predicted ATPase